MTPLELGEKLAIVRGEVNQVTLAKSAGKSRQWLSLVERGETSPSVQELDAMLQARGWTLRRFFESKAPDNYKKPSHAKLHHDLQEWLELDPDAERTAKGWLGPMLAYARLKRRKSG